MNRNFQILAAAILAAIGLGAGAAEITVGDRQIMIPIPDGYTELTPEMKPYYEAMRAYAAPANYRYLSLIPLDKAQVLLDGGTTELGRYMNVESEKGISSRSISAKSFDDLRGIFRGQLDDLFVQAQEKIQETIKEGNATASERLDAKVDISVGDIVPLPIHTDTPSELAFSMYANYSGSVDGEESGTRRVASTTMILHVQDKVLFLYVYGAEAELEWTRDLAASWAEQINAANPVSAEVKNAMARSEPSRKIWDGVLRTALIGAVIGGAIGLFSAIFRRRKNRSR